MGSPEEAPESHYFPIVHVEGSDVVLYADGVDQSRAGYSPESILTRIREAQAAGAHVADSDVNGPDRQQIAPDDLS